MAFILPLLALTVGVLVMPAAVSAGQLEDEYIAALQDLAQAEQQVEAAKAPVKAEAATRADIIERRDAALTRVEQALAASRSAVSAQEVAKPLPTADQVAFEARLHRAMDDLSMKQADLELAREELLQARSTVAVAKVEAELTQARIDTITADIAEAGARIDRITAGDRAELDVLAHRAVQEKEAVSAAVREFTPAFQAAIRSARIVVGMHLPALYRAKQALDQVTTTFCGRYTSRAREYVDNGLRGVEAFLRQQEGTAQAAIGLAQASMPSENDARCGETLASAGIAETEAQRRSDQKRLAREREALQRIGEDETNAQNAIVAIPEKITQLDQAVAASRAAVRVIERESDAQRRQWEAELAARRAVWSAELAALQDAFQRTYSERDDIAATFKAELDAVPSVDNRASLAAATAAEKSALTGVTAIRARLANNLGWREARSKIKLTLLPGLDGGHCIIVKNGSAFAIAEIKVALTARGQAFDAAILPPLTFKGTTNRWSPLSKTAAIEPAGMPGILRFRSTDLRSNNTSWRFNGLPYLMPGGETDPACVENGLVLPDAIPGIGKVSPSLFAAAVEEIKLADPDLKSGDGVFGPLDQRYKVQLEQIAAGTRVPEAAPAPAVAPIAAGTPASSSAATLSPQQAVRIQQALIAAGLLTGRPDGNLGKKSVEAIGRWQAAQGHKQTGKLTADELTALIGP